MKTNLVNFDYSALSLEPSQVTFLEDCASGVESGAKLTVQGIMEIGKALSAAREVFGQDDKAFGKWRQGRLPWLEMQTSINFMRVYSKFGSENLPYNNYRVDSLSTRLVSCLMSIISGSGMRAGVSLRARARGGMTLQRRQWCPHIPLMAAYRRASSLLRGDEGIFNAGMDAVLIA